VTNNKRAGHLIARLDRISVWSLPFLFIGIIGIGFLFTFYDIFDINVSFIQTCAQIVPSCSPHNASGFLGLPVLLNLVGYVIGTLILSPISDRIGRRDMLLVTMLITGLGSLATVFVHSYLGFNAARILTGVGIGADLAVVNTYINEVAPSRDRVKYTSLIFLFSALGAFVGIWLGLILTTPATPFPLGLPFAVAGEHFAIGWRVMYAVGGLLALIGILLRFQLPESPRWLVANNRLDEAEQVVQDMEERAQRHGTLAPVTEPVAVALASLKRKPLAYSHILLDPKYLQRTLLMAAVWFIGYITVYSYAAGFTSVLSSLNYPPPEAGLIAAFGTLGFIACALFMVRWGEIVERGSWILVAAVITLAGGALIALAGHYFVLSVIGAIIVFFGFNMWVPVAYSWSTEQFPTRARTTGFALVDGVGHLGGGVGLILIAPLLPRMSVLGAFTLIGGFLVVAGALAQLGVRTRARVLDEVSP